MSMEVADRTIETDEEGYLVEPADWDERVAEAIAAQEGLALGEKHWAAIRFMREFYDEHRVAADARFVIRHLESLYPDGGAGRNLLFELFPYGYVKQACRIAGMKRPRAWSTG